MISPADRQAISEECERLCADLRLMAVVTDRLFTTDRLYTREAVTRRFNALEYLYRNAANPWPREDEER